MASLIRDNWSKGGRGSVGSFLNDCIKPDVVHAIESSVGTLLITPIVKLKNNTQEVISDLVAHIIAKQKVNPRYDYVSHEQVEIDRLVYEAYGLNADDIQEVETWYARRYPKLAGTQARNRLSVGAAQATPSTPLETETNA